MWIEVSIVIYWLQLWCAVTWSSITRVDLPVLRLVETLASRQLTFVRQCSVSKVASVQTDSSWMVIYSAFLQRSSKNHVDFVSISTPNLSFSLGFRIGNCWRNGVSPDRVDRRWLSSCRPGMQDDVRLMCTWYISTHSSYCMRSLIVESQCRLLGTGVMWPRVPIPATSLAAAFWTRWSGSIDFVCESFRD